MTGVSDDPLFRRSMAFCGWCGIAAVLLFIVGGCLLGGMLPPLLRANDSAAEVVSKLSEHMTSIRVGSIVLMCSFALFGPFGAGIAAQTRRAEQTPVFSYVQLVFTSCGTTIALLVAFCWALMVFRLDEYDPTLIQFLPDAAYFFALFSVPCFGGWCLMIALPIFLAEEGREPFPRWVAYVNLWAAVLYGPGQMVLFFKDGPFSWHGVVALWIPYIAYFGWIMLMSLVMLRVAKPGTQTFTQPVPA